MTEEDARAWLLNELYVSRETLDRLEAYIALVCASQHEQNLVSAATLPTFWARHIVDSAQLILAALPGSWLDIGSGAGMPGMITAIITGSPTTLVEPRRRRADFLQNSAETLQLANVTVAATRIEMLAAEPFDTITARAVAPLPTLMDMARRFAHRDTVWILPKGKTAQTELASLPQAWQCDWALRASVTDPEGQILVGRNIGVKSKR